MADFEVDYAVDAPFVASMAAWILAAEVVEYRSPAEVEGGGRPRSLFDDDTDSRLSRLVTPAAWAQLDELATASDGVLAVAVALPAVYAGATYLGRRSTPLRDSTDAAVIAWEGGLAALALAEVFKVGADEERPYVAMCGNDARCYRETGVGDVLARDDNGEVEITGEARASFYSGHASLVAGTTFALAQVVAVRGDGPPPAPRVVVPYVVAAGLTTAVSALRVESARHYPSDVVFGSVVGAAVGVAVAEAHRVQVPVTASPTRGGAMLAWSGAW